MYTIGFGTKIAFCKDRDNAWRSLASEGKEKYYNVVFRPKSNTLLVLRSGPRVDSWDLSRADSPRKTTIIQDSYTRALKLVDQTFPEDLYTSRWYLLALSPAGEVLVIGRYIGEFVRHDGEVVREEDTLTDLAAEPLICPYKTLGFCVLMVSEDGREWVEVKSLADFVLFLGGNESLMASSIEHKELKKNSIYFTDDYWERVDEDYNYGGHDMGVFDIGDGRIQPLLQFHQQKFVPPPFWVTL